jgi:arylsulfatase A
MVRQKVKNMAEDISPAVLDNRSEHSGLTRRSLMTAAAGVAGVAVVGVVSAESASAQTPAAAPQLAAGSIPHDIVAVLSDANNGVIDLYFADQHIRVTDRQLTALLARAAH